MNWKLIWVLSVAVALVAIVIPILAVGSNAMATAISIGVNIAAAIVIVLKAPARHFAHGFWTGFFSGVFKTLVLAAFAGFFLSLSPALAQQLNEMPIAINPRLLLVIVSPFAGALSGLILAVITWVVSKVLGPDKVAPSSAPPPPVPPLENTPSGM